MNSMIIESMKRPCKCGCGNITSGLRKRDKEGNYQYAEYCHGHHKGNLGTHPTAWNKGLTKEECPVISRMGYQKGHKPYNDFSKINNRLRTDPDFKQKWIEAKKGNPAWNKGLSLQQYPNGITRGEEHGNYKNGTGYQRNRMFPGYKRFTQDIFKRDDYTCQYCNQRGGKLNAHHIVPASIDINLVMEPSNVITLCHDCHFSIHFPNRQAAIL